MRGKKEKWHLSQYNLNSSAISIKTIGNFHFPHILTKTQHENSNSKGLLKMQPILQLYFHKVISLD